MLATAILIGAILGGGVAWAWWNSLPRVEESLAPQSSGGPISSSVVLATEEALIRARSAAHQVATRDRVKPPTRRTRAKGRSDRIARVTDLRLSGKVLLKIENISSAATFLASIEHIDGIMDNWPTRAVFAKWDHQDAVRTKIPKDGHAFLVAGRLERRDYCQMASGNRLPFTSDCETRFVRSNSSFMFGTDPHSKDTIVGSTVRFLVTIYADEGIEGGPYRADIQLAGGDAKVTISQ